MDTQNEPDQERSGELHLPPMTQMGTQYIVPPAQPDPPASSSVGNSNQDVFYVRDDDDLDAFHSPLATPFQMSDAMPPIPTGNGQMTQTIPDPLPPGAQSTKRFLPVRVLIPAAAIVVIIVLTAAIAFAQSSPAPVALLTHAPSAGSMTTKQQTQVQRNIPTVKPTPSPLPGLGTTTGAGSWLPQHLPTGWTTAGLMTGDAFFSERTAVTFTDREMSLDYRSVGSRANHAGTFTAATFLLTAHAMQRFAHNDVRVSNNVLFDTVHQQKRVQSVVNAQPHLTTFSVIGQQQMALVDVSFQLWQSKIDATGARTDGFDIDPVTHQPRTHHMTVLLLRVPQDMQGANPAMGGTGWLVSTYALDLPAGTTLDSAQPA